MPIAIRPATAADQRTIAAMVRGAGLNPFELHWRCFLIAEDAGQVAGIGQVRAHGDGSRELASLVVIPERQAQGIGSQLVEALLAREVGPTYLFCRDTLASFYARFGFYLAERQTLPRALARMHRLANLMTSVESIFRGDHRRILVMRRDLPTPSSPISTPLAI
jgi:amino-acid N-acetyltransferase